MNKHWVWCLVALGVLTGCKRSADLAVRAVSTTDAGEVPRAQLVIRLLPYDRDSIFTAMGAAADRPEPQPPEDLLVLRDSIAAAQDRWREAEAAWNDVRSELQQLSERMQGMDRSSNQYFEAYERFDALDAQESRLGRAKDRYFQRFTELQSAYTARADSFRAVLTAWEDEVFADYGEIVDSLQEALGREDMYDTTDASGWAQFIAPKGRWYIHTRFKLPFEELYWSVPYDAVGGGVDTVILNESNAEVRPVF